MYRESRYQEQLKRLNDQDKRMSFEKSTVPEWYVYIGLFYQKIILWDMSYIFRFEPVPEAGKHKGLTLVLDAHQDLVSASSVSEDFLVNINNSLDLL